MNARPSLLVILAGAAGAGIAVAVMELLSAAAEYPLWAIPFATSIALVMASPEAEPAQPRPLVGGHLVSTLVGLVVLQVLGAGLWPAALAVGLAIIAMHLTGTFHPPAGIDPLRREREVEVGPGAQAACLEHRLELLPRRSGVGRRLEDDELALL